MVPKMRLSNWAFLLIPATCLALVMLVPASKPSEDWTQTKQELAMKVAAKKIVLGRELDVIIADAKKARDTVAVAKAAEAQQQTSAKKNGVDVTDILARLSKTDQANPDRRTRALAIRAAERARRAKQAADAEFRVQRLEKLQEKLDELVANTEQVRKSVNSVLPDEPSADTASANKQQLPQQWPDVQFWAAICGIAGFGFQMAAWTWNGVQSLRQRSNAEA
jgi:hypothetical protein